MKLKDDGLQIWTDFEGLSGTHLYTVAGAALLEDLVIINGREELRWLQPRDDDAWDHIARRRVVRVEFDDGTIDEYRISSFNEAHSVKQYHGEVVGEGAIMEMNGPGLCELVYTGGDVDLAFDLLSMTVTEHLDNVILPAGPSFITKGTIDPTEPVDLTYERFTPLRALQALLDATVTERHLIRQAGGAYQINVLDQRGGAASVPVIQLGKNLRSSARETDDRETRTRIYPVGGESEDGQVRLQDARWIVTSRDTVADWVVLEITQRGRTVKAVWQDDAVNGFSIGNPDGTEIQLISDSAASTGRVFVPDASLYAVNDELQFYETASKKLAFLEDKAKTSTDTDRRPEAIVYNDLPPARNLVKNPRLDAYTGGNPDNWVTIGTPTTVAEDTTFPFHDIGSASLHVVCDAAKEGIKTDTITITPTADNPYFIGWVKLWIVSGRVIFHLAHSVTGKFPPDEESRANLAVSSVTGRWVELIIQPGTEHLFEAGTLRLNLRSEGDAAEFYLDGAMLTQTAALTPFFDGQPAVELWDRAAQRFLGELVSTEVKRYTLGVDDLSDLVLPFDALTAGGNVEVDDPDLSIDVTTRMKSLRRDLLRPAPVQMELDTLRDRFTETAIRRRRRRRRRRVTQDVEEQLTLTNFEISIRQGDGALVLVFNVSVNVKSVKFDTSTTAQPSRATALAGTSITVGIGNHRELTTIRFVPGDTVFVTAVPTDSTGTTGKQGPTYERSLVIPPRGPQVTQLDLLIDETDGAVIMRIEINEEVNSIRYATAVGITPAWPTDANVEVGTIVNGTTTIDVTLAAATIAAGETLRVRVAPYMSTGGVGPGGATDHGPIAAQEVAWRPQRGAITHTIRVPFADILPKADNTNWDTALSPTYLHQSVVGLTQIYRASIVMPQGVTMTQVSLRGYRNDTLDKCVATLHRLSNTGTTVAVATLMHSTSGWQTKSATISEIVATFNVYVLFLELDVFTGGNVQDARFLWLEIVYDRDDDVTDSY